MSTEKCNSLTYTFLLILILLLGWGLRLHALDRQSFWSDEGLSVHYAGSPVGELLQRLTVGFHNPLYFLGLHFWMDLAGRSDWGIRFYSAFFSMLAVPLLYMLGRQLYGRSVGLIATLILAANPFAIYYAQEARMYAQVLALSLGVAVTFLLAVNYNWFIHWLAFVVLTTACLYTHYFAALAPIAMAVYYVISWLNGRYRATAGRWLLAHLAVAILYAPWLTNAFGVVSAPSWQEPTPAWRLPWNVLVSFSLGEVFPFAAGTWLAVAFAVLFWLGCYGMYRRAVASRQHGKFVRQHDPDTGDMAEGSAGLVPIYLAVPLLAMMVLAWSGRGVLDKYVMVALPPFCLTLALGVQTLSDLTSAALSHKPAGQYAGVVLAVAALALILATDAVALKAYYTDVRYFKHDYRSVAAHITAHERSGDVILADGINPNIIFERYYTGRLPIHRVDLGEADQEEALLAELASAHDRAWLVLNFHEPGRIELWLENHGYQLYHDEFSNVDLYLYALPKDMAEGGWVNEPPQEASGPVRLAAYRLQRLAGAAETVYLDLVWRVAQPPGVPYKVSVRLTDPTGLAVWVRDRFPVDGIIPSATWPPGRDLHDRLGIPIPPGTLPGKYIISAVLYEATTGREVVKAALGPLELEPQRLASGPLEAAGQCPANSRGSSRIAPGGEPFGAALTLCGYDAPTGPAKAGERLTMFLLWRVRQAPGEVVAVFRLIDRGTVLSEQRIAHAAYPSSGWQPGEWVRYPYAPRLEPALDAGRYDLTVNLERADSGQPLRGQPFTLMQVDIRARPREYRRPGRIAHPLQAQLGDGVRLLGYDLIPDEATPGGTITLTLYWEALGTMEANYPVFTHLLTPDGRLAAGHDSPPLNGDAPTTSWLAGEFLTDRYQLPVPPDAAPGEYPVEVGMYDPTTGQRLPVTVDGVPQPDGRVLLSPTRIR